MLRAFANWATCPTARLEVRTKLGDKRATLTHDDWTRVRTLSPGHREACVVMRDEVLVDVAPDIVRFRCHVSGAHPFLPARMRSAVFRLHMPAVVDAAILGMETDDDARIIVEFESHVAEHGGVEDWGSVSEWGDARRVTASCPLP